MKCQICGDDYYGECNNKLLCKKHYDLEEIDSGDYEIKKEEKPYLKAMCSVCENVGGYDEESLKASTYIINGIKVVLCIPCEDDLLVTLAKGRGINIKLGEGREVEEVKLK